MDIRHLNKYCIALAAFTGLCFTSCSESDTLEQEGNAIRFSAKLLANEEYGEEAPAPAGQEVAVLANGRTYNYTLATDGSMTCRGEGLAWKGQDFDIKAWTPVTSQSVQLADQTTPEKMAACDLLAAETKASSPYVALVFKHQMTRMVWDFASIDPIYTTAQIRNAKVYFIGYSSTKFNNGKVAPENNADQLISTYEADIRNRQGEAIMAPADMWNKPLIKVEIGGDEFVYTPSKDNAADLASAAGELVPGHTQKYHITIAFKKLSVKMETLNAEWGSSQEFGDNDITDARIAANIATEVSGKPGYTVKGLDGRFVNDRNEGFSISYTENGLGGLSWSGDCQVTRTETVVSGNQTTHTYTFKNIKSDVAVSYLAGVEVGDYLYDNGAWGKEESREGCKTIGRVFRVGLNDKDDSSYSFGKVRGYVVPMTWSDNNEYKWFADQANQQYLQALAGISISADDNARESYYGGYKLTGLLNSALAPYSANWQDEVPFWNAFKNNGLATPTMTSGWYVPTIGQLKDIFASGLSNYSGAYLSSQVYAGTGNAGVHGIEEGDKNTIWAIRCGSDQSVTYGWAIDAAKLLPVLTF